MDERTVTLDNAYYRNVLFDIEELLLQIPGPAHIQEKPERSVTQYIIKEPALRVDEEKKWGSITLNYSQTTTTEFAAMVGLVMEKDPIVFECSQVNDQVVVKDYCSAKKESAAWILPIFGNIWQKLLDTFSS